MDRRSISTLLGIALTIREPRKSETDAIRHDMLVIVRKDNGATVAQVARDDLFDKEGNRFSD